ncbi:Hpt domain-containing protein, partial [Blastomonas sp. CCH1-A6]
MSAQDPIAAFRVEAGELLGDIEQALLDLSHDLTNRDLVDSVFRGLHTLKGSGAMFGFDALAGFTHHCETAFDRVRKGQVPATEELVAVILSAMDHMQALVDGDGAGLEAVGDEILDRLHQAIGAADASVAVEPTAASVAAPLSAPAASGW